MLFFKNDFHIFDRSHIFLLLCKKMFISIFPLFSVTFGAVTVQAFVKCVKSISLDRIIMCYFVSFLKGKNFLRGGMCCTMDNNLSG